MAYQVNVSFGAAAPMPGHGFRRNLPILDDSGRDEQDASSEIDLRIEAEAAHHTRAVGTA